MLDHFEDTPILNTMFGRSSAAAPVPKPMIKRRASPLKESPARGEEDETSDCPMEQVTDENPSASQQPENVHMEQVDYDPDSDDDDSDEEGHPPAGRPTSKAMPHPKLVPKSPPPALRLVSKVKPAPKNILDEETESDNHPGDRPALPRRPVMRPVLTSNDRWFVTYGSDTNISLQKESVRPGPFGNSKFLSFVHEDYRECSTILDVNPDFHFVPEHQRPHGVKVFWLKARFNDYWQPTLQGEGPHAEKQYMDFIKKVYSICCYTNAQSEVLYSSKQESLKASSTSALIGKKRKEATATEIRAYQKQFLEAKQLECKSWLDNEVFDLVDTRKVQVRNWVTGRWVLTLKRDKDGNFLKTKARRVLRGFQDKQKNDQQTDSPAASRGGFRLAIQAASNKGWNIFHMDLKTAFLQGEAYDQSRAIICQIPPEIGYPPHIGMRMKKPAYGLNDAPRRWWNILDSALRSYGQVPTRADRCTYVYYGKQLPKPALMSEKKSSTTFDLEGAFDPVSGNNAKNRQVHGALSLHVDDLLMTGVPRTKMIA